MLGMELFETKRIKSVQTTISVESRMIESTRSSKWMNNGERSQRDGKSKREIKRLRA